MYKYKNLLVVLFIMSLFLLGCENIPFLSKPKEKAEFKPPPDTVAIIGNFYITNADLNKEIEDYNALLTVQGMVQNKIDTRDEKIAYLRNELVKKYILYQEALDRRLNEREDIAKALERNKINLLVSELLRREMEKIEVSSKEIEEFYNENKELLKEPEQRRIFEIVTDTEDEAKQVYIELLKGADFSTLARQYSKAPTASKGGDLGFITFELDPDKRIKFDKFYEAAFALSLEPGGISNIFKGPDGFYIIKLESKKESETKSLSELWENIKSWLLFEKQQKAIKDLADKLAGETRVEIYEGKIE